MELEDRLASVAGKMSTVRFPGAGMDYGWDARAEGESLVFSLGGLTLRVSQFKLVDPKFRDGPYRAVDAEMGVRYYFYEADVDWRLGDEHGKGHCILANSLQREIVANRVGIGFASQVNRLLAELDKVLANRHEAELLGEREPTERSFGEDRMPKERIF